MIISDKMENDNAANKETLRYYDVDTNAISFTVPADIVATTPEEAINYILDSTFMKLVMEESLLAYAKEREKKIDIEALQIQKNYQDSLRTSLENPGKFYTPNVYDESDLEEWDSSSDLE